MGNMRVRFQGGSAVLQDDALARPTERDMCSRTSGDRQGSCHRAEKRLRTNVRRQVRRLYRSKGLSACACQLPFSPCLFFYFYFFICSFCFCS